ncbi:hypothetical protein [Robertmurraya siralis]|uniref:hypothetical protein n=1 Tax=Robertmurraya siralis TaxID=77777 RepID=UPI0010F8B181|nr:hypothetical protein [Robertmurraya siralis]
MKYTRKSAIVEVEFPKKSGRVITQSGELLYFESDVILTHKNGDKEVLTRKLFEQHYSPVEEVKVVKTKKLSPFEMEEFVAAYQMWNGAELNPIEDTDYISKTKELIYK